jgi:uncharacterized membrane protein YhaH (DUF805 family)
VNFGFTVIGLRSARILWIDCAGGLIAGVAVLILSGFLSDLYAIPHIVLVIMGVANLAYGFYALSLYVRRTRPRSLLVALVIANATWAVLCLVAAMLVAGTATVFGLAHLVGEGVWVGGLAALEWQRREQLSS